MNTYTYQMGIDIGSTTEKVVVLDPAGALAFSIYRRHNAETLATLQSILQEVSQTLGNIKIDLLVTGSAGMGIAEKFNLPFIQEVVASAEVVRQRYPEVRTLIDIGGEDAKIIFFDEDYRPDIRMNGSCAGGTGAFIDEMANLLNVPVAELDNLAGCHTTIYPMASRCGVFAKTDLQNLLSRQVAKEDIAASVFHAVVLQTLATLARGRNPQPAILFSGGPLTFIPSLKEAFLTVLNMNADQVVRPQNPELLTALGAALAINSAKPAYLLQELIDILRVEPSHAKSLLNRSQPLFESDEQFQVWEAARKEHKIARAGIDGNQNAHYFMGIDSGSTTTKLVLIDSLGRVVYDYYANNGGNSILAVQKGLKEIRRRFESHSFLPLIARSVVTGYGEDLIRAAFGIDEGMVETLAHFRAAKAFDEQVSFILDIGGQDMKAIFIKDGHIQNIEINEACSSGCGSFIESFSNVMGYNVADFAQMACSAQAPCNLGTRCTVFMNSRVKQALREGAEINDISAGLAYSVIKNALHKVLKITNTDVLGEHIVVQGGTFRNPAIHKALEQLLGKAVICPDMAELMGAYGAALTARDAFNNNGHSNHCFTGLQNVDAIGDYAKKDIRCKGCENKCLVTKLVFPNGNNFYSGNRCEKIYSNGIKAERKGANLPALKYDLLFDLPTAPQGEPVLTLGIPRALNMFENYPFWNTLFVECGIKVQLSAPSSNAVYQDGAMHIMSENLCFPGKLVSGHIMDLIKAGVDRIFYPMVFYEQNEFKDAVNTFNCPVVSGYPDVISSSIDPQRKYGIPLDMPAVTFRDKDLLERTCIQYLSGLGIPKSTVKRAFRKANQAQTGFKEQLKALGAKLIEEASEASRPLILLMGRPYHIDPLINHNIPNLLTDFGVDIITEDSIPMEAGQTLDNHHVITQWEYLNRYLYAARWVGMHDNVELVLMNSFGCGPDPFILEELRLILREYGKSPTIIRIDEVESPGSIKLRLRSMMEYLRRNELKNQRVYTPRITTKVYEREDRDRTLIVPDFSPFCSPPITRPFIDMGYQLVQVPPPDHDTVEAGLKYTNNELCYPAIICIGALVKALQSGSYDLDKTAIGFSQTGGQCRATSYTSMIKKALVAAGFAQVPVVTLATSFKKFNDQPGFNFDLKEYVYKSALGMMFMDALSDMYHSTIIKEKQKGATQACVDRYLRAYMNSDFPITKNFLLSVLEQAVKDFNNIDTFSKTFPKAGIVGEIYAKYNPFSNNYAAQWLMDQGIEVVEPSFFEFFAGGLIGIEHNVKTRVKKRDALWYLSVLGQKLVRSFLHQFDEIMQGYRDYHGHASIQDIAGWAQEIISLNHQYGEGWLIAGEIAAYAKKGVQNVLCLQPFGCIANHVIAKGVQKRMVEKYPHLNLLFLDIDAGVSEVNFFNRMHFFVNNAKELHINQQPIITPGECISV
jgi:predicted CoA-substrate-specific enzyme activase